MKKREKKVISHEGWKTTKKERINYYIGDLGRTLEGYIVTAFMTLFLLFQGISLRKISAAIASLCDETIVAMRACLPWSRTMSTIRPISQTASTA